MFPFNQVSKRKPTVNRSITVIKRLLASMDGPSSQTSMKPVASNKDIPNSHRPRRTAAPSPQRVSFSKGSATEENGGTRPLNKVAPPREVASFSQRRSPEKNDGKNNISLPRCNWIKLSDVPPLATLDDILDSVNWVLNVESEIGIIDLDAANQNEDGSFPRLKLDLSEPWVKNAQVILSTHARPTSWGLELENRSIVNAFLQHARENGFYCAWKRSEVTEWGKETETIYCDPLFDIDDCVVRVENCHSEVTPTLLRTIFRHYDLSHVKPNICSWENEHVQQNHKIFLLRFDDPSWARAAIRDMQGVTAHERRLRLAQYPKQNLEQTLQQSTI
mmetsp:Transcript_11957/g.17547  ORF Transcript_11957/g.17547 Transcript_11957/m.17547 type:complete len:333 (-) Transcript_11957:1063-2061(-)